MNLLDEDVLGPLGGGGQLPDEPRAGAGRLERVRPRTRVRPARIPPVASRFGGSGELARPLLRDGSGARRGRRIVREEGLGGRVAIVGVDLVGMFAPRECAASELRLVEASLADWRPDGRFDLITCVHGLHYVGDKLGLIARAASWLAVDGRFVANLTLANVKFVGHPDHPPALAGRPPARGRRVRPEPAADHSPGARGFDLPLPLPRRR